MQSLVYICQRRTLPKCAKLLFIKVVKVYSNIWYEVTLSNAIMYNTSLFDYAVVVQCGICKKTYNN